MDYRYGSHTVYQIEYHFVWVTKYRYKVLSGEVAERVRELVRQTCEAFEIRIVKVESPLDRHYACVRNQSIRGLESDNAAPCRGYPDGTALITPDRRLHFPQRDK